MSESVGARPPVLEGAMKELKISIPDSLQHFVQQQLENGTYASASEVVRDGLLLLKENETRLQALRQAIRVGEESGDPINLEDISVEDIARRGLERLRLRNS
jgi:antitoxin ParD1/3/4